MVKPINLIPGPRRHAKACRRLMRMWVGAAVAWAVVLLAVCALSRGMIGPAPASASSAQDSEKVREDTRATRRAILTCERQIAEVRESLQSIQAIGQQPDWSVLLAVVAEKLGEDVVLEACRLQEAGTAAKAAGDEPSIGGRFLFRLSGLSRTQPGVSEFIMRLENCGLFDQVRIVRTTRQDFLNAKAVAFELECLLQGSPERAR